MVNIRRTRAMAVKEIRHILRDPRSLTMALAIPLLMLLLFGLALSLDVDRVPLLIRDQDKTQESRQLIARFHGSRYFEIVGYTDDDRVIQEAIDSGHVLVAMTIPQDYSRNLLSGHTAEVQFIFDGSDSNTASIAQGYAQTLVREYSADVQAEAQNAHGAHPASAVDLDLRIWYNSSLQSKNYIVPGLVAVIMMIIAATLTSLTIAREWETGTMEQLLSTPLRPAEIVLGKMLAYFAVGFIDMVVSIVVGVFIFKVPFRGSYVLLVSTSCLFLFGSLLWGIFLSAVVRSQLQAYQMGMLSSFLPAFLLSGFIYSIENMPAVIRVVTRIVPARYFVTILKGIFLKGVGLKVLWVQVVFLALFAVLMFRLATKRMGRKLA
jgi:ABC-2 type transport system permease protein